MYLVWIGVVLIGLKAAGLGPFAELSWWWVLAPLGAALIWFEGLERAFGLDRRTREHERVERARRERKDRILRDLGRPSGRSAR
ncbi:MAG: TIGR04438 family Trp-rich protein [Burkholderiales bacterium]|nr:MAG: TIGR04438 family Trp-rich protein [Burkholderiales bacterium]